MKFCSENASDIEKYFRHTYMKFPDFAGDRIHYVERVLGDRVTGHYFDEQGDQTQFQFDLYPEGEGPCPQVEYILPVKSWFQFGEKACFLYRLPLRQYKKGINEENTQIVTPDAAGKFPKVTLDYKAIAAYTAKPAFTSLRPIVGQETSLALSPRIGVHKNGRVFVDTTHVATVNWEERTVYMHESIFKPEIVAVSGTFNVLSEAEKKAKKVVKKSAVTDDYV